MAFKLFLTDAFSPLGNALSHELKNEDFTLIYPQPGEVDWCDPQSVREYIVAVEPSIIVNTVGWSQLADKVERKRFSSAAKQVAAVCTEMGIPPIHLSSYQVFGGENKTAYNESDRTSPVDTPGRAYRDAERVFKKSSQNYIVLRLSWVIGTEGDNLLTHVLHGLSQGAEVKVSSSRRGAPTFYADVARVVSGMINQILCGADSWGIIHYCSRDSCTEAEFAHQVARLLQLGEKPCGGVCEIEPHNEEAVASAVLSGHRGRDSFGVQARSWRQGLAASIDRWIEQEQC